MPAGILTAGVWDDNRNYDRFSAFLGLGQSVSPYALFTAEEHERARHTVYAPGPKQKLDISLVIDTTGSMGDELAYLQRELDAITARIKRDYPSAEQRWSLVLYRDNGDAYTVRWFNFRADVADYRTKLAQQAAAGGGDYAEATDQAIDIAQRLQWRRDAQTARLVFWVADAPHHAETTARLAASVRSARVKGIHVYPVASSGVDEVTEASMRSIAQLTGGRNALPTRLTHRAACGLPSSCAIPPVRYAVGHVPRTQ
ncbi:MAG: VWA domain-containing protein [Myxococcales bacterium]|nr:VWA domain-containing protein [Myxococcales bacterium]